MPRYATKRSSLRKNKERTAAVGILSGFFVLIFGLWSANITNSMLASAAVTGIPVEEHIEMEAPVSPGEAIPVAGEETTEPESDENGAFGHALAAAMISKPQEDEANPEEEKVAEVADPAEAQVAETPEGETGEASYYGPEIEEKVVSEGEEMDSETPKAAHRTLPLGSQVRVTNLENGKTVTVEINDRGPFVANRLIDLSQGAAKELGMETKGSVPVKLEVVS